MNIRQLSLSIAAVAALSPVASFASPAAASAKACAAAFAETLSSQGLGTPAFRVDYRDAPESSIVSGFYERDFTFKLQARDAKSGAPVATATCSTDARGKATVVTEKTLVGKL